MESANLLVAGLTCLAVYPSLRGGIRVSRWEASDGEEIATTPLPSFATEFEAGSQADLAGAASIRFYGDTLDCWIEQLVEASQRARYLCFESCSAEFCSRVLERIDPCWYRYKSLEFVNSEAPIDVALNSASSLKLDRSRLVASPSLGPINETRARTITLRLPVDASCAGAITPSTSDLWIVGGNSDVPGWLTNVLVNVHPLSLLAVQGVFLSGEELATILGVPTPKLIIGGKVFSDLPDHVQGAMRHYEKLSLEGMEFRDKAQLMKILLLPLGVRELRLPSVVLTDNLVRRILDLKVEVLFLTGKCSLGVSQTCQNHNVKEVLAIDTGLSEHGLRRVFPNVASIAVL
jgi:hypothetical protein